MQSKRGFELNSYQNNNNVINQTMYNEPVVNLNLGNNNNDTLHNNLNNNNLTHINYGNNKQMQHAHSSYVRLSLDNEDFMKAMKPNVNNINSNNNVNYQ